MIKHAERAVDHFMAMFARGETLPEMLRRLCEYVQWTRAGLCMIRDQSGSIVPLNHNRPQLIFFGTAMLQAAALQPIRLIVLKSRKVGMTTSVSTFADFNCAHYKHQRALTMAHEATSTLDIFEISRLVCENYRANALVGEERIRFRGMGSWHQCRTAGGESAGAGGTPTVLHISEVALCTPRAKRAMHNSTISVPDHPSTMIVQESTARGRDPFFHLFESASADPDHPYEAIFIPWFMDEFLSAELHHGERIVPDDYETWLIGHALANYEIEVTSEKLKWRRMKIKSLGGNATVFRQQFPATPREAIQGDASLIYVGLSDCVIDELPFDPRKVDDSVRFGGIDYGHRHPFVCITGYFIDGIVYVADVFWRKGTLARDRVHRIYSRTRYFCDPSGAVDRAEILAAANDLRRKITLVNCPRMSDEHKIRSIVQTEIGAVQLAIIEGRVKILLSASERLLLEADNFFWNDKTGEPNDTWGAIWEHFDALAAFRYFVVGCLKTGGMVASPPPIILKGPKV